MSTALSPEELALRKTRERTMSLIANAILVAFVGLLTAALFLLPDAGNFGRIKELIGFVSPILGVVVGFYFNKAAMEPRAEKAEQDARQANAARTKADQLVVRARGALAALATAAEPFAADDVEHDDAGGGGPVGSTGSSETLRRALQRARSTETELDA